MSITNSAQGVSLRAMCAGPNPILMIGDSRTYQVNWNKLGPYPLVNCGFGGYTFKNMLDTITSIKPTTNFGTPAGAVIMLGINDLSSAVNSTDYNNLPANIVSLINLVRTITHNVIICTAMPREKGFLTPDGVLAEVPYIQRINYCIRNSAIGQNVPIVDLATAFSQTDGTACTGTTQDGLHMNYDTQVKTKAFIDAAVWANIPPYYSAPTTLPSLPPIGPTGP